MCDRKEANETRVMGKKCSRRKRWAEEAEARKDKTLALQKGSPTAQKHAERIGGVVYVPLAM